MDIATTNFVRAGSLEELKAKGRLVVRGPHRPIHDRGRVFALDNRCPHMGFPLDRGSVEDGIPRSAISTTNVIKARGQPRSSSEGRPPIEAAKRKAPPKRGRGMKDAPARGNQFYPFWME
jgi:hypothetical protein